jgi:Zn-dependent M28 family amino/carboxypeptidase
MTIARAFMESGIKPSKTIIFALWSSEESGLLGSRYYVENLTYPLNNLCLNVNFDMISRYVSGEDTKKVTMVYNEEFPSFRTITEDNITKYGIDLDVDYQPSKDPPGGSDHRSFTAVGVPVMRFKPGHREEYHTPYDEISTIDWEIMEKIVKISFANTWDLANSEW